MQKQKDMAIFFFFLLFLLVGTPCSSRAQELSFPSAYNASTFNRRSFPAGFVFGTASSSYQYEGAAYEDGKGPSIWDTFTQKHPEKIADRSNGNIALDQYHKYKEDIAIMKEMGLDAYRFSISWPRLLPNGKLSEGVNRRGVDHYNDFIDELLRNGIQPYVTLFHWELPQTLEDEYGGLLSPRIVEDFKDFVDVCFKEFGDRVKNWITMNEPYGYSYGGYTLGISPPNRCSAWQNLKCSHGDSGTEPYLVSHHQLLAHAAAVKLYRDKYKSCQKGKIGITLVATWFEPYSRQRQDRRAASRAMDFQLGWFLDPMTTGEYPKIMRSIVGNRLPRFSKEESIMLKGSFDFVGLNYYSSSYARDSPKTNNTNHMSYLTDHQAIHSSDRRGVPIGPPSASSWICSYPRGLRKILLYVKKKYGNPLVYITENGMDEVNNSTLPLEEQLNDTKRIDYHYHHLSYLRQAIKDGVNVKAYFAWTFLDDFEWISGYTVRFGLNYVDYNNGLKRYSKSSAIWFKSFLNH